MEARDAFQAFSPTRVSVHLDGTAGPVDRVRVDLADSALRGAVDVGDARLASRLNSSSQEVLRALAEKGFDPQSMTVRLAAQRPDAAHAVHEAAWAGLGPDAVAGSLRSMLSGNGRGAQDRPYQGSRDADGRSGDRQQQSFNQRSRGEQRRERR